jgi:hypothetical protein
MQRVHHPLSLEGVAERCFCDWTETCSQAKDDACFRVEDWTSNIFLRADRVHQYANECGPEPTERHYEKMFLLLSRLREPNLAVVNLANSGASVPQHFHTQIYSLSAVAGGSNSIRTLWESNVSLREENCHTVDGVIIKEVERPVWGLRLQFDERYDACAVGRLVYRALHRNVRYRSQLNVTYDLFMHSANFRTVTALFRLSAKERMFALPECHNVMRQFTSVAAANRICRSPNRQWRWAWLEVLGGFPARDASFADTTVFNWRFWSEILALASPDECVRKRVTEKV